MSDYQVMPNLSTEEYDALKADIAEHGIRVPVDVDDEGNVLDGHHRRQIAAELGIECPTRVVPGLDEEGRREHALTVNVARRQLTREQRRHLIAAEIERCAEDSDRAIARRLGCDHKTVGSIRRELRGEIPQQPEVNAEDAAAREWADLVESVLGHKVAATPAEMMADLADFVGTMLGFTGWCDAMGLDNAAGAWRDHYLPGIGARYRWRAGKDMPSPPIHLLLSESYDESSMHVRARQTARDVKQAMAELDIRISIRLGEFLNWACDHNMYDDEGGKFFALDPECFRDCSCKWCKQCKQLGFTDEDLVHAAVGHAYYETGVNFAPVANGGRS